MTDERQSKVTWILQEKGSKAVQQAFRQLRAESEQARVSGVKLAEAYKVAGFAGEAIIAGIGTNSDSQWARALANAQDLVDLLDEGEERAKAIADALKIDRQRAIQSAGSAGRTTAGLRSLTSAAGLSGASGALNIGADIVELTEELPKLKDALASLPDAAKASALALGASGVGLVGGLVLLAVAIALFNNANEQASAGVKRLMATQEQYFRITQTNSREQITSALEAAKFEAELAQARINENKFILEGLESQVGTVGRAIFDALDISGTRALRESTQELEKELKDAEFLQRRYTDALSGTGVAVSDQIQKILGIQSAFDRRYDTEIAAILSVHKLTGETARDRIGEINLECVVLTSFAESAAQTEEHSLKLKEAIKQLGFEEQILIAQLGNLDAIEQRTKTIEATKKFNEDVQRIEETTFTARNNAANKYSEAVIRAADAAVVAAENALRNLQNKRDDLKTRLGEGLEDARLKADLESLDALIEVQREELKAKRIHADNLKRIQVQSDKSINAAIQNRDSVALSNAIDSKKEQISAENERFKIEARERRIAFDEKSVDQGKQFKREEAAQQKAYDRAIAQAELAYRRELDQAEIAKNRALAAAAKARDDEFILIDGKYKTEYGKREAAIAAELALIQLGYDQRKAIIAANEKALLDQAKGLQSKTGQPLVGVPKVTSGGGGAFTPLSTDTGRSFSTIAAAETARRGNGASASGTGNTFNLSVTGATQRDIIRQVNTHLVRLMDRAGILK